MKTVIVEINDEKLEEIFEPYPTEGTDDEGSEWHKCKDRYRKEIGSAVISAIINGKSKATID